MWFGTCNGRETGRAPRWSTSDTNWCGPTARWPKRNAKVGYISSPSPPSEGTTWNRNSCGASSTWAIPVSTTRPPTVGGGSPAAPSAATPRAQIILDKPRVPVSRWPHFAFPDSLIYDENIYSSKNPRYCNDPRQRAFQHSYHDGGSPRDNTVYVGVPPSWTAEQTHRRRNTRTVLWIGWQGHQPGTGVYLQGFSVIRTVAAVPGRRQVSASAWLVTRWKWLWLPAGVETPRNWSIMRTTEAIENGIWGPSEQFPMPPGGVTHSV